MLFKDVVPVEGLEPPPSFPEQILSLPRLPVPPHGPTILNQLYMQAQQSTKYYLDKILVTNFFSKN